MHPDLQLRLYFLQERHLDHMLEKRRLARERGTPSTTAHRGRRVHLRGRRA